MMQSLLLSFLLFSSPVLAADLDKGIRAYDAGNYAAAHAEFRSLAERGDAVAQVYLAIMYYNGKGTSRNYDAAIKWYHLAAKQGYAKAQYNLGAIYYTGQGAPQNYVKAVRWFRLAAKQGYAKAQ
ncbi:MAG: tetratricopeptide repeat protein, partial [Candidatus Puniceispirillum sp.]